MKAVICDVCGTKDESGEEWAEVILPASWIEDNQDPETGIRIDVCSPECLIAPFRDEADEEHEEEEEDQPVLKINPSDIQVSAHQYLTPEDIERATGVKRRM